MWCDISGNPVAHAAPFGIMGIINITPDSFYQASRRDQPEEVIKYAHSLLAAGADIIDLGAESSRPGATEIAPGEEWQRLEPVLQALSEAFPAIPISIDTRNSSTAALALDHGASIINDISACRHDPGMVEVLADKKPGYVLMHARGKPATMQLRPNYSNVMENILSFFACKLELLQKAGLPANRIVIDPGIGFGKLPRHNITIMQHIGEFLHFQRPLLIGISMKSLFASLLNLPVEQRSCPTAVLSALLWQAGVEWHRVHDVKKTHDALMLAQIMTSK